MTQFWLNDPSVLLNKDQITEVWPNGQDSLERKRNAITRIIILLGFLGFLGQFRRCVAAFWAFLRLFGTVSKKCIIFLQTLPVSVSFFGQLHTN